MRPKKIILVVMQNEQELSVMKYMLETNGYRVLPCSTAKEAEIAFNLSSIDLALIDQNLSGTPGDKLTQKLKSIAAHIPMILMCYASQPQVHTADALIHTKSWSPSDLLERIKIMAARKRGPRKGTPRAPRLQTA